MKSHFGAALALFLLAPFVGEVVLGDLPFGDPLALLISFPMLAFLYGSGAVLIREIARRTGRGYPTILTLAFAYGVLEEALVTRTLFNGNYMGLAIHEYGKIPGIDMAVPWTIMVLTLHSVWSIVVPIALAESLFPKIRHDPWLKNWGVVLFTIIYIIGAAGLGFGIYYKDQFIFSVEQFIGSSIVIVTAIISAFILFKPKAHPHQTGEALRPLHIWLIAFILSSVFLGSFFLGDSLRILPAEIQVFIASASILFAIFFFSQQSQKASWTDMHKYALMAGPVSTYIWYGFFIQDNLYKYTLPSFLLHIFVVAVTIYLLFVAKKHSEL